MTLAERLANINQEHEQTLGRLTIKKEELQTLERRVSQLQGAFLLINELLKEEQNADKGNN